MKRQKGKKVGRALGISLAVVVIVFGGLCFLWYASFANMKKVETAYFDKDGKFACSEENPFREELLSKLVSVCTKAGTFEEASPYAWDKTLLSNREENFSEFTILAKDGAKYEIYDYAPLSAVIRERVTVMKRQQRYLYIERTKGEKSLIYRVKFDETAEEIWELIGKAKGYAYNQMGTFRATLVEGSESSMRYGTVDSPEYGRMDVRANSFDRAVPGDTVEVTMLQQTSRFGINDEPWVTIKKAE